MPVEIHHQTPQALADVLAGSIAADLGRAVQGHGRALLILPGGSSPSLLMTSLARQTLDWDRVVITTTDERCVPPDDPQSNAGQVIRLFSEEGIRVDPVLLWRQGNANESGVAALPWPADVCVLGMGVDGHIASLFPGGNEENVKPGRIVSARAPLPPHDRVSLTIAALLEAKRLVLLVSGYEKLELCKQLLAGHYQDLPLARLIDQAGARLELHMVVEKKDSEKHGAVA